MSGIEISIIVTTWNRREQLGQLLCDIERQIVDFGYEIIVADSFSDDGTADFINQLALSKTHIRLIQCRNSPAAKRNEGARVARGAHLLFLDDDVRIPKENILSELRHELSGIGDSILSGRVRYPISWVQTSNYYRYRDSRHVHDLSLAHTAVRPWCFVSMCSAMRRDLFLRIGGYSEAFDRYGGEDHDFEFKSRDLGVLHILSSALEVEHYEGFSGVENYVKKFSRSAITIPRLAISWPQYMSRGTTCVLRAAEGVSTIYRFGIGRALLAVRDGLILYLNATDQRKFLYSVFFYRLLTFIAVVDGIVKPSDGNGFYGDTK